MMMRGFFTEEKGYFGNSKPGGCRLGWHENGEIKAKEKTKYYRFIRNLNIMIGLFALGAFILLEDFFGKFSLIAVIILIAILILLKELQWKIFAARWHAAEHKVLFLMRRSDLPLTIEEARKAPMISERCGYGNKLLKEPWDFQLREVLEAGRRLKERVENNGGEK